MLIDELQEQLKTIEPDITTLETFWKNAGLDERFHELKALSSQENFWQHKDQTPILRELQKISEQRERYYLVVNGYQELKELLALFETDETQLKQLQITEFASM